MNMRRLYYRTEYHALWFTLLRWAVRCAGVAAMIWTVFEATSCAAIHAGKRLSADRDAIVARRAHRMYYAQTARQQEGQQ